MNGFNISVLLTYLENHKQFIKNYCWMSLPEMTNANGELNEFSCNS